MAMRRTAPVSVVALALALAAVPARVRADDDDPIVLKMRFIERGSDLTVTTSVAQLFDSEAYEALGNGFVHTAVIRMWVYRRKSSEPIAFQLLQRRVVYDMWEDVYTVRLDDPVGRRTVKVKERSKAFTLLTSIDAMTIAPLADVPHTDHHLLAVVAELNPVSKETLAEVRRWLSQGTGGGSFFGSFVSVFVNPKVAEADRILRMRSQPFYRPAPKSAVK
jgi:hypothetical protein